MGELSNRQLLTISHILNSSSIEEACKKARISRTTFYIWLKDEEFKKELKRQHDEVVKNALDRLKSTTTEVVEKLIKLMDTRREEVRRLAWNSIIEYALKSIEVKDIEQRQEKVTDKNFAWRNDIKCYTIYLDILI